MSRKIADNLKQLKTVYGDSYEGVLLEQSDHDGLPFGEALQTASPFRDPELLVGPILARKDVQRAITAHAEVADYGYAPRGRRGGCTKYKLDPNEENLEATDPFPTTYDVPNVGTPPPGWEHVSEGKTPIKKSKHMPLADEENPSYKD